MKKIPLILLLTIILTSILFSQNTKRANIWYFGGNAGIDFNTFPPTPILDGALDTGEGCATICDTMGNLIIYTDGRKIWNKNHEIIPGAISLGGNNSSTQSGLIVPLPDSDSLLYIFSMGSWPMSSGLQYSIVDISLNNNLGGLITSNETLSEECRERVLAILHCNKKDFWIISHEENNNTFLVWLLTSSGISNFPNVVQVGTPMSNNTTSSIGYLKSSLSGTKVALGNYSDSYFEVFDFNNTTGEISNPIKIEHPDFHHSYGIGFSPDGKRLYLTGIQATPILFQVNLDLPTAQAIQNSTTIVGQASSGTYFGAIQNAPDGRIYIARNNREYLSVIQNPNALGTDCNFLDEGFQLDGNLSRAGLPNLISSHLNDFPSTELVLERDTFCINETEIELTGGIPIGGNYSGLGVAGNIFEPSEAGVGTHLIIYSFEYTNGCICSDSAKVIVEDKGCATGINQIEINNSVKVFPNPSNGDYSVFVQNWTGQIKIQVFDSLGQLILTDKNKANRFQIKAMQKGIYLLKVSNDSYVAFKKLITQ